MLCVYCVYYYCIIYLCIYIICINIHFFESITYRGNLELVITFFCCFYYIELSQIYSFSPVIIGGIGPMITEC